MVSSFRSHPNLQADFLLSNAIPIMDDWMPPAKHDSIVAQYVDGNTLNTLACY